VQPAQVQVFAKIAFLCAVFIFIDFEDR